MPLYHVQDDDRPAFVVAEDYAEAINKWTQAVALEEDLDPESIDDPLGIALICDTDQLILGWRFEGDYPRCIVPEGEPSGETLQEFTERQQAAASLCD